MNAFLDRFYDSAAGSWRYPPADGYVLDPEGQPVRWVTGLLPGQRIDRYGSEFGSFLAPRGLPYTTRSIPPSNLVGTPAAGCNYRVYEVLRPFAVNAGPIAPWFFQSGGGLQYQLSGALVPGAPANLSVGWLVPRAGNQATNSAAQLPSGGVAGPPKYDPVRGRTGALPAETWIHRLNHRISGAGH